MSSYTLSQKEVTVLRRGLSFCPDQNLDTFDCVKDYNLFARKFVLKVLMEKKRFEKPNYAELCKGYTVEDFKALKDLILLMQGSEEIGELDSSILGQDIDTLMVRSREVNEESQNPKKYKLKSSPFEHQSQC